MKALLETLEPLLRAIVDAEIAAGNEVIQADASWPRQGHLCVHLKTRFKLRHKVQEPIRYFEDRDPHGPVAEYVHGTSKQSVMCSLHPL